MDYSRQMTRQQYVRKRRRRRKIIMRRILFVFVMLILLGALIAGAVFLLKGRSNSGTFERNVDITDKVTSDMAMWLSDINEPEIDADWVRGRVGNYSVKEILVLSDGNYLRSIDQDSYNNLVAAVYSDLARLLTEVIKDRLTASGYKENLTNEETAQISAEILGMSIQDYLASSNLPVIQNLQDMTLTLFGTDVGTAGTYKMRGGKITESDGINTINETLIKKRGTLIFTESGRIYNEKK